MKHTLRSLASAHAHQFVLCAVSGFILWWFRFYFTSEAVASVDLPSQIAITEQLKMQLLDGRLSFYDPGSFSGWPVLQFYAFLPSLTAAGLALLFETFAADAVTLSIHVILVVGMALLPFSLYYAALPLARELCNSDGELGNRYKATLALTVSIYAFWFLNHDEQYHGIGAAAPMNIGLYAQLFGWHFFLIHAGALLRFLKTGLPRDAVLTALSYALLLASHLLTFVFASFLVFMAFLWVRERRLALIVTHIAGIALTGFWLAPMLAFMGEYTAYGVIRPKGDFLELFFRYPIYGLARSFATWFNGDFKLLNPINVINLILVFTLLAHRQIKKTGQLWMLFVSLLLAIILFSSGFVATSIPLGLHYYRFLGLSFLLLVLILCVIPLVFVRPRHRSGILGVTAIGLICFAVTVALPHDKLELLREHSTDAHLAVQHRVIQYFAEQPLKGRVYVETLKDQKKFTPLSKHYISSRLFQDSGFESIVNSHLQESIAYRMIVASTRLLGASTYNVALLFTSNATLDDAANIEQLKSFGITHLVAGRKKFYKRIKPFAISDPIVIDNYRIVPIQELPLEKIAQVRRPVIGYLDPKGNLPFHLVEFYFYARKELGLHYELVELEDAENIPAGLSALLVNHPKRYSRGQRAAWTSANLKWVPIEFKRHYLLDHYKPHYPHNVEIDHYHEVEDYFDDTVKLADALRALEFAAAPTAPSAAQPASFTWSPGWQSFRLDHLQPGAIYRINYSYFPYWRSQDGLVLRGSGERIFFIPKDTSATFLYSNAEFMSTRIGYLTTFLGLILLGFVLTGRMPLIRPVIRPAPPGRTRSDERQPEEG